MAMLAAASRPSLCIILLSSAFLLHFCLPSIAEFVTYQLPSMYGAVPTLLRPLYLYILINCIILSIVASSKIHHGAGLTDGFPGQPLVSPRKAVPVKVAPKEFGVSLPYAEYQNGNVFGGVYDSLVAVTAQAEKKVALVEEVSAVEVSDPTAEDKRSDSTQFAVTDDSKDKLNHSEIVKQPFPARFNHPKRIAKSSPEGGKALTESRTRQNDTMENTWRRITDGRETSPTRRLKKSDTWREKHARRGGNDENVPPPQSKMKKTETFKKNSSRNKEELCGETWVGQDELNRRVEAFIRKFNEEMRLEREASLKQNQFQEMI